ncbi:PepSY domain-containing protein [Microbacterium sp. gxy059]|uniref:PepSY domain-containing protein n=1 Tax=Microbacterium sp. gxy059 TaxID=2957199 RepID=UPI003D998374
MNAMDTMDAARRARGLGLLSLAAVGSALLLAGCSTSDDPAEEEAPREAEQGTGGQTEPEDEGAASEESPAAGDQADDLSSFEASVTWQDAVTTAQESFDGDLISIGLERERSEYAYSVELASDSEEYEATISATSGEVLHEESEKLDDDDAAEIAEEIIDAAGLVEPADALAAATGEVEGTVTSWSLDRDWEGTFFEVEVLTSAGDRDVVVDAESGEVVGTDD